MEALLILFIAVIVVGLVVVWPRPVPPPISSKKEKIYQDQIDADARFLERDAKFKDLYRTAIQKVEEVNQKHWLLEPNPNFDFSKYLTLEELTIQFDGYRDSHVTIYLVDIESVRIGPRNGYRWDFDDRGCPLHLCSGRRFETEQREIQDLERCQKLVDNFMKYVSPPSRDIFVKTYSGQDATFSIEGEDEPHASIVYDAIRKAVEVTKSNYVRIQPEKSV